MTWNAFIESSVASGRWSKRGGERSRAFDNAFRGSLGAGSVSGVEALSFSALTPGDMLEDREGGFDSFGEVEALRLSFLSTDPFAVAPSSILTVVGTSDARSPSSIFLDVCAFRGEGKEGTTPEKDTGKEVVMRKSERVARDWRRP